MDSRQVRYKRIPGASVRDGMLRVLRMDDQSLTNPNQGASWNFPTAISGKLEVTIRLEKGGSGVQIVLTDRWFNPTDSTVQLFANYVLHIDNEGKTVEGQRLLIPGKLHSLSIRWNGDGDSHLASVMVDDQETGMTLPCQNPYPNGISYLHLYNPAHETDPNGFSIRRAYAESGHQ